MRTMLSAAARSIIAKTDAENRELWLPLHYHLLDTAAVMARLLNNWLPMAARQLLAECCGEEALSPVVSFLAMSHDLGKATPAFQQKVVGGVTGAAERQARCGLHIPALPNASQSPHALAGEALLRAAGVPGGLASIVGAHHGRPADGSVDFECGQLEVYGDNYRGRGGDGGWQRVQGEYLRWALAESGVGSADVLPALPVTAQMLLTGLLIMADWIASGTRFFPLISADDPAESYDESRIDAAWARLALTPCWTPCAYADPAALCGERFDFERPNALQRCIVDIAAEAAQPGILVIEAQMGSGKTEAALLAAELFSDGANGQSKRGGIFFGLPTQATANGIFERVRDWGERQAEYAPATIRLAHSAAELNDAYAGLMHSGGAFACVEADAAIDGGLVVQDWFRGRKQALLADFVVGTVDQLLMLALKQRHVMLRHLGLCGKVAIIDECHAYDAYMNRYLEAALRWLGAYRVPVILLSATLPAERRCALVDAYLNRRGRPEAEAWRECRDYPLITWTDGGQVHQRTLTPDAPGIEVALDCLPDMVDDAAEAEALAEGLAEALSAGGCAGVIVNTVRRAQDLAQALRARLPDFTVMLIHAQYVQPDRAELERALLRRVGRRSTARERDRLIVVGTQICEQSLDLDFDYLATDLCPMDLLLQRLGRLHRHRVHDAMRPAPLRQARCLVMGAGDALAAGSAAVYGEYLLLRTRALLPNRLTLPDDIPALVQDTYDEAVPIQRKSEGCDAAREKHMTTLQILRQRADTYCLKPPAISRRAALNTLDGLLDAGLDAEKYGEQAVRDGDPSIEALVLRREGEFLRTVSGGERFSAGHVPDARACREIAAQKLRLPHALCAPHRVRAVIDELTARGAELLEWGQSPWLRGQLYLLLDEDGTTELCGFTLRYDRECGLMCRKEDAHAGH